MSASLLHVENLGIHFGPATDPVKAVDGISFDLASGETVAVVGESGSGKSVTALALTRLLSTPPARFVSGKIEFAGRDVLGLSDRELRAVRGKQIAYVFQEPSSSLNPVFTIGFQIREALELHRRRLPMCVPRLCMPSSAWEFAIPPAGWAIIRTS